MEGKGKRCRRKVRLVGDEEEEEEDNCWVGLVTKKAKAGLCKVQRESEKERLVSTINK